MIFRAGDLNKIKDLLYKYGLLEGTTEKDKKLVIHEKESIGNLLSLLD
jgi:hypothetical protein